MIGRRSTHSRHLASHLELARARHSPDLTTRLSPALLSDDGKLDSPRRPSYRGSPNLCEAISCYAHMRLIDARLVCREAG